MKQIKPYSPANIEPKWQQTWEKQRLFQGSAHQEGANKDNTFYNLFAFAYPSGSGLHVGHVESKAALDILARFNRMHGKKVFFPVGWDAFGLPAENYAIKTGVHPSETTKKAIDTFRRQIKRLGISYDWESEIATCHPQYYKWTQWIFLQLFNKGLAYKAPGTVNWCPSCQTVLANEQVVEGACERCGSKVEQKELEQWYFKITTYQDELISGLQSVDWPRPTEDQQINWIGKSVGAEVDFEIKDTSFTDGLTTFTTRLDTIFGVSFIVISPEKARNWIEQGWNASDEVKEYLDRAFHKTEEERKIGEKNKTGVNTGLKAINPVNEQEVPIWVADYVLAGYGTGAVMGVPGHDERDHAFANKFSLEIIEVVTPKDDRQVNNLFTEDGILIHSGDYTGLESAEARTKIAADFSNAIRPTTTYRLRDWLISRQRYWGAPIPIVYDPEGKAHPVKEEHLPWLLPTDVEFKPTGESPLKQSKEFKQRVEKLYGKGWTPEYDTMDTFVDSSWYFLRYTDARNTKQFASKEQLKTWLPVDFYMIGPEHIVLHLLYSRFFTKFLRDQGYLDFDEPFMKMRHQGMILGPDHRKMSKSKGNVIDPDEVIETFGADTLRMYEMFMGPIEADKPWSTTAVNGVHRFLKRVWRLSQETVGSEVKATSNNLERKLHQTIQKVSQDIPELKFNTAIAAMMEFVNEWEKDHSGLAKLDLEKFVLLIAPFAPFISEEIWQQLHPSQDFVSVHQQSWPAYDKTTATEDQVSVVIQVNGKVRDRLELEIIAAQDEETVIDQALQSEKVKAWVKGETFKKVIFVPGKLLNLVV